MVANIEWDVLRDTVIAAAMLGILGPLMAINRWDSASKRPMTPAGVRLTWIFFGTIGLVVLGFGVAFAVFHVHA